MVMRDKATAVQIILVTLIAPMLYDSDIINEY